MTTTQRMLYFASNYITLAISFSWRGQPSVRSIGSQCESAFEICLLRPCLKHTQLVFWQRPSVKRTDRLASVPFLRHFLLIFLGVPCTHYLVSSAYRILSTSLPLNPSLVVKPFVGTGCIWHPPLPRLLSWITPPVETDAHRHLMKLYQTVPCTQMTCFYSVSEIELTLLHTWGVYNKHSKLSFTVLALLIRLQPSFDCTEIFESLEFSKRNTNQMFPEELRDSISPPWCLVGGWENGVDAQHLVLRLWLPHWLAVWSWIWC